MISVLTNDEEDDDGLYHNAYLKKKNSKKKVIVEKEKTEASDFVLEASSVDYSGYKKKNSVPSTESQNDMKVLSADMNEDLVPEKGDIPVDDDSLSLETRQLPTSNMLEDFKTEVSNESLKICDENSTVMANYTVSPVPFNATLSSVELKLPSKKEEEEAVNKKAEERDFSYSSYRDKYKNRPKPSPKTVTQQHNIIGSPPWNSSFFSYFSQVKPSFADYTYLSSSADALTHGFLIFLTFLSCFTLFYMFYKLSKSSTNPRRKKTVTASEDEGEDEIEKNSFSNKLRLMSSSVIDRSANRNQSSFQYFHRSLSERDLEVTQHEKSSLDSDFLLKLQSLLTEFLENNPLEKISSQKNIDKKEFKEILSTHQTIESLFNHYSSLIQKQKKKALSSASSASSLSASSLLSSFFFSNKVSSYHEQTDQLLLLKDLLVLYYRYVIVVMKMISFFVSYEESYKIYEIVLKLEEKVNSYKNQNEIYEQSIIDDLIYNQCIVKKHSSSGISLFSIATTANNGEVETNSEINGNMDIIDIQLLLQECDKIISDYYESKRIEIENEEKNYHLQSPLTGLLPAALTTSVATASLDNGTVITETQISLSGKGSDNDSDSENYRMVSSGETKNDTIYYKNNHKNFVEETTRQTYQLISYFHSHQSEIQSRKRLQDLRDNKERIYQKYFSQAGKYLEKVKETRNEKKKELDQELNEVISGKYEREMKQVNQEMNSITNLFYFLQKRRNIIIFQLIFVGVLFQIISLRSNCQLSSFSDQPLQSFMRCCFQTLEQLCMEINQKTQLVSSFSSSSPVRSSVVPQFGRLLFLFVNPMSSAKWLYLLNVLQQVVYHRSYLLSSLASSSLVSSAFHWYTSYSQICYCLLMLLIRYLPILAVKTILRMIGISWDEKIISSSTVVERHHHHHDNKGETSPFSLAVVRYQDESQPFLLRLISKFTLFGWFKFSLFLYCFGDILQTILFYFFWLFFVRSIAHCLFYLVFDHYSLSLINLRNPFQYFSFYAVYVLFIYLFTLVTA
jgi:hypothetical protein